jgi:hypothetical protein
VVIHHTSVRSTRTLLRLAPRTEVRATEQTNQHVASASWYLIPLTIGNITGCRLDPGEAPKNPASKADANKGKRTRTGKRWAAVHSGWRDGKGGVNRPVSILDGSACQRERGRGEREGKMGPVHSRRLKPRGGDQTDTNRQATLGETRTGTKGTRPQAKTGLDKTRTTKATADRTRAWPCGAKMCDMCANRTIGI